MPRYPYKLDCSGGLPACIDSFSVIEDTRTGGNKLTRSVTINHRLDGMDSQIRGKWRTPRSLPKKRCRAMLDINYRNSLLSLA
jgi:hypothetical protein